MENIKLSQQSILLFTSGLLAGISICWVTPMIFGDVEFFIRSYSIDLFTKVDEVETTNEEQSKQLPTVSIQGMVLPSWLDRNIHMSNARYVYELNFSRRHYFQKKGLWGYMRDNNCLFLVQAQTIRYRKELKLWDRYTIQTRIVDWNDRESCFYVESRFIHEPSKFVAAIHHLKYKIVSRSKDSKQKIKPTEVLNKLKLIPTTYLHHDPVILSNEDIKKSHQTFVSLWENANHCSSLELNPAKTST